MSNLPIDTSRVLDFAMTSADPEGFRSNRAQTYSAITTSCNCRTTRPLDVHDGRRSSQFACRRRAAEHRLHGPMDFLIGSIDSSDLRTTDHSDPKGTTPCRFDPTSRVMSLCRCVSTT